MAEQHRQAKGKSASAAWPSFWPKKDKFCVTLTRALLSFYCYCRCRCFCLMRCPSLSLCFGDTTVLSKTITILLTNDKKWPRQHKIVYILHTSPCVEWERCLVLYFSRKEKALILRGHYLQRANPITSTYHIPCKNIFRTFFGTVSIPCVLRKVIDPIPSQSSRWNGTRRDPSSTPALPPSCNLFVQHN